jgi:hypothetical protein
MRDTVDPEFKAELEAQQKKRATQPGQQNPLANFDMAGFLAGTSKSPSPAPPAQEQQGRGGKKR